MRVASTLTPGGMAIVDQQLLFTAATYSAKAMASATNSKLPSRALETFDVESEQVHKITTDEDGILSMASVGQTTRSTTKTNRQHAPKDIQVRAHSNYRSSTLKHVPLVCTRTTDAMGQKYTVQPILRNIGFGNNIRCADRWYGYGAKDKTANLAKSIPFHFITQYQLRQ